MPKKSLDTGQDKKKTARQIFEKLFIPKIARTVQYKNFIDVCKNVHKLSSIKEWKIKEEPEKLVLTKGYFTMETPIF